MRLQPISSPKETPIPLHQGALGKVMLAYLESELREKVISGKLARA
jgi:DNA-binding IclR family transcriptional regulator